MFRNRGFARGRADLKLGIFHGREMFARVEATLVLADVAYLVSTRSLVAGKKFCLHYYYNSNRVARYHAPFCCAISGDMVRCSTMGLHVFFGMREQRSTRVSATTCVFAPFDCKTATNLIKYPTVPSFLLAHCISSATVDHRVQHRTRSTTLT